MSRELHILEPWSVLRSAELLSLDVTTGNLRVRVAGGERTYIGTSFRFIDVRLPLNHIMAMGMPGGAIDRESARGLARRSPGRARRACRNGHAHPGRARRGDPDGQGKLEGRLASEWTKQDRRKERRRPRQQPAKGQVRRRA